MSAFYLQFGMIDNATRFESERYFIDHRQHKAAKVVETIEAESWIDARETVRTKYSWAVE